MDIKTEILTKTTDKLQKDTGISFKVKKQYNDHFRDVLIELKWNKSTWYLDAEVNGTINRAIIGRFRQNAAGFENTPVLITTFVTPGLAEQLRELKINYIDTAGNAYLNIPPLLINIQGNRPGEIQATSVRLFRTTGLKIIFALLCNPELEIKDYRTIASMTNVALGSVNWIMRDLAQAGYLLNQGKNGRRLIRKDELLEKWVSNYHEQLRPKIIIGRYAALDKDWWKKVEDKYNVLWGSEKAAGIITKYLKPEITTIYIKELTPDFLIRNKLHSTSEGDIEILKKFWLFDDRWTDQNVVPPILVYADLIAGRSDRNIETAKIIYDKEISGLIRQN
ncbi:MAG: hypothetical protein GXY77_11555 [Fibrobacter sp.]|nr:hypothetical protein [Fibrobacter sp.]